MRSKIILIACGISLLTGIIPSPVQQTASAQVSVSFQAFYDQLSPFGTWVDYPGNGYVWVPNAGSGFRPYGSRGHWVYTEEGWAWVSNYSWGWAPFHYGNWFYDNSYGWMWTPGYRWAPAWVTWGEYGGNYCWAPIGPRVDIGVSFGSYRPPYNYWNFCPRNRINSVNVSNYYVTNIRNTTTINNITVINNVNRGGNAAYLRGPAPASVEKYTHSQVRPVTIQSSSRPGAASLQRGQLALYRPAVQSNNAAARPARIQNLNTIRPVNRVGASATTAPGGSRPAHVNSNVNSSANRPATNRPVSPATNRPVNPVVNRPTNTSVNRPANNPVNRPANTSVNRPGNTPANRPVNTPTNRPTTVTSHPTPANRPATAPVSRPQPTPQKQVQPRPAPQPTPQRQVQPTVQPRPAPQQHPVQQSRPTPQPRPVQQAKPAPQPRTAPGQQTRPAPQPRPAPAQQPRPVPEQRPVQKE